MNLNNQYLSNAKNWMHSLGAENGVNAEQFKKAYLDANFGLGGAEAADYNFKLLDSNNNGKIDTFEAASVFKNADQNKDGNVTFQEAKGFYTIAQSNLFPAQSYKQDAIKFGALNQAKNWLGTVSNGQPISVQNFQNIYTSAGLGNSADAQITSSFLDIDRNGQLDETEIANVFYTADTNQDGSVDGREVQAFYSKVKTGPDQPRIYQDLQNNYQLLNNWRNPAVNLNTIGFNTVEEAPTKGGINKRGGVIRPNLPSEKEV